MTKTLNELLQLDDPLAYVTKHLDEPISVEASAGCGKTFTLIARVCELLKSGRTTIDRLLLLTFTENAASEMKNRLVETLHKHESEVWAQTTLETLHLASIKTIHSFAYDICTSFHDTLGLPDDISIVDQTDEQELIDSFFNARYNAWGNQKEFLNFFKICKILGLKRSDLKKAFQQIKSKVTFIPGDTIEPSVANLEELVKELNHHSKIVQESAKKLLKVASALEKSNLNNAQSTRLTRFFELADAVSKNSDPVSLLAIARNPERYIKSAKIEIKITAKHSSEYIEFENSVIDLASRMSEFLGSIVDSTLRIATGLLFDLAIEHRARTFSIGQITFDDSIVAARRAIEIDSIREQLWTKYDSIIVDEFQDTDIHQLAIIDRLADDQSEGDLARIFVVGDEKQSIYGFRGATVEGYKDFVRTRPIKRIALSKSRRTVPSVIETINTISNSIIPEYIPMQTTRENIKLTENYHLKIVGDEVASNVEDIREQQSADVVSVLNRMNNTAEIFDSKLEKYRPCNFADMAILIRDKNSLSSLTTELESENIPYAIDSSALVWELTMVKAFLAISTAIAHPRNGFAVVAALKTPVFEINNDELSAFAIQPKKESENSGSKTKNIWDYRIRFEAELENLKVQKVRNALESLREFHYRQNNFLPTDFVRQLLFETTFFQSFAIALGESHSTSVSRFLLSDAMAYEIAHPLSRISDYVDHLIDRQKNSFKTDSLLENVEQDKLRVLTIHSSKGLEFPIVGFIPSHATSRDTQIKVAELNSESHAESYAISLTSKIFDSRLTSYKDSIKDTFIEEESRLIYVALTRAQDHLIISAHHKKFTAPNSQATLIGNAVAGKTRYICENDNRKIVDTSTKALKLASIDEIRNKTVGEFNLRLSRRKALLENIEKSHYINASSMKPEDDSQDKHFKRKLDFLSDSQAPSVGKTVHRVMNIIDFGADENTIRNLCQRCAYSEGIRSESEIEKCVSMVKLALSMPLLSSKEVNITREVPISGVIHGKACEGYIDCLIQSPSGYIIVDYKTDTIDERRPLESKIELHSFQLAFYSILLKQALKIDSCRAVLAFLNHPERPWIEVENLALNEKLVLGKMRADNP